MGRLAPCFMAAFCIMMMMAHAGLIIRYATHPTLNAYSALIQNYFSGETQPFPAVHITVDTELTAEGQGLGVKGWVSSAIGLTPKAENCVFLPVPVAVKFAASERAGRKSSSSHHPSTVPGQITHVQLISSPQKSPTPLPLSPLYQHSLHPFPTSQHSLTNVSHTFNQSMQVRLKAMSKLANTFWRVSVDGPLPDKRMRVVFGMVSRIR